MEIEISPATPPREWSPASEEDPHTLGTGTQINRVVDPDPHYFLKKNLDD
jgi:hypothetical protein